MSIELRVSGRLEETLLQRAATDGRTLDKVVAEALTRGLAMAPPQIQVVRDVGAPRAAEKPEVGKVHLDGQRPPKSLDLAHHEVWELLVARGPMTSRMIAESLYKNVGNINRSLARLREAGFARRGDHHEHYACVPVTEEEHLQAS